MPLVCQVSAAVLAGTPQLLIIVRQHAAVGTSVLEMRDANDAVGANIDLEDRLLCATSIATTAIITPTITSNPTSTTTAKI